ncbi:Ig-like domain-containing protein [Flavivirga algicola]|uniref:T9SS type A sorting domain-containing protein n=1 Tax=Flavivirga algicola TaxID=2729136 RepID=A0ABX1S233_9FLAO|nr:Ig-like domain-containing protein [Flavivirga algicola]NMH88779.1 T9SS type A sorting domain-containing protein [Flavivirga algicola]
MKSVKFILILYVFLIGATALADPPPAPPGYKWQLTELYSDEFNGNSLDLNKWRKKHPFWNGRKPAWFNPDAVSVSDGYMKITNGILSNPFNGYDIYGGAVTSVNENTKFAYYECRLKASSTRMSTTFWLENRKAPLPGGCGGDTYSQELDIVETIGDATNLPVFATHQKSNTHFRWRNCNGGNEQFFSKGTTTGPIKAINSSGQEVNQQSDEGFHTYGAWWRDSKEVTFYLDDKEGETVQFRTDKTSTPFNRGMFICMVTETYDWEQKPTNASLTDPNRNTSYYDWVRVWTLVPDDGSPIAVTGISVSPGTVSLDVNQTESLTAVVSPFNATNKAVVWNSDNTSVATVDANGLITAISAGNTTITAITDEGRFTATSIVTVNTSNTTQTVTLSPIHDAYTQNGINKNNTLIRVENTGRVRIGYLQYDLGGINGVISSAQLKMTCNSDAGNAALAISVALGSGSNWAEGNISSANAPLPIGTLGTKQGPFSPGTIYTWNLNAGLLNGGDKASIIITASGSNDDVAFAAKEHNITEPQLMITYNSASTSKGLKKQSDISTLTSSELKVYPNPIVGSSFVVDLSGYKSDVQISIYDIHGRLLYEHESSPEKLRLKSDIFQTTGLYVFKVKSLSLGDTKSLLIAVE